MDKVQNQFGRDVSSRKIFLGNLPRHLTPKDLQADFSKFGTITACHLKTNPDGTIRGFGFIEFRETKEANVALNFFRKNANMYQKAKITVEPARNKKARLYIGNIPKNLTPRQLERDFEKFGKLWCCQIQATPQGKSKGFGYLHFEDETSAHAALREHAENPYYRGRRIKLQPAKTKKGDTDEEKEKEENFVVKDKPRRAENRGGSRKPVRNRSGRPLSGIPVKICPIKTGGDKVLKSVNNRKGRAATLVRKVPASKIPASSTGVKPPQLKPQIPIAPQTRILQSNIKVKRSPRKGKENSPPAGQAGFAKRSTNTRHSVQAPRQGPVRNNSGDRKMSQPKTPERRMKTKRVPDQRLNRAPARNPRRANERRKSDRTTKPAINEPRQNTETSGLNHHPDARYFDPATDGSRLKKIYDIDTAKSKESTKYIDIIYGESSKTSPPRIAEQAFSLFMSWPPLFCLDEHEHMHKFLIADLSQEPDSSYTPFAEEPCEYERTSPPSSPENRNPNPFFNPDALQFSYDSDLSLGKRPSPGKSQSKSQSPTKYSCAPSIGSYFEASTNVSFEAQSSDNDNSTTSFEAFTEDPADWPADITNVNDITNFIQCAGSAFQFREFEFAEQNEVGPYEQTLSNHNRLASKFTDQMSSARAPIAVNGYTPNDFPDSRNHNPQPFQLNEPEQTFPIENSPAINPYVAEESSYDDKMDSFVDTPLNRKFNNLSQQHFTNKRQSLEKPFLVEFSQQQDERHKMSAALANKAWSPWNFSLYPQK